MQTWSGCRASGADGNVIWVRFTLRHHGRPHFPACPTRRTESRPVKRQNTAIGALIDRRECTMLSHRVSSTVGRCSTHRKPACGAARWPATVRLARTPRPAARPAGQGPGRPDHRVAVARCERGRRLARRGMAVGGARCRRGARRCDPDSRGQVDCPCGPACPRHRPARGHTGWGRTIPTFLLVLHRSRPSACRPRPAGL